MTLLTKRIKNIQNLLSKEQTEILETALLSMAPIILTKLTGQFFNLLAASYFGTTNPGWNQFNLATSIPDMITNVFLGGSITAIVVPFLIACRKQKGKEEFLKLYSSVINSSIIVLALISFIFALSADFVFPLLLKLLVPNQPVMDPKDLTLVISMMRVLLIPQIILGFSVLISSGLNMYNRYLIPQISGLFFNFGRILGLVILLPIMNFSPWAIVIGVILGSILHLAVQIPLFRQVGLTYTLSLKWTKELKNIFITGFPRTLALMSENIGLTFNDFLAYSISSGSLASLNYANSLSLVVPSLFAQTFAYAAFTKLSEHFEDNEWSNIVSIIIKSFNEMLFLSLPFIVTLLILRIAVVRLAFGLLPNTHLNLEGTYQIAWVLLWFAVGHIFVMGRWFMYRVFYAAKNTTIPFIISTISLILTIILSVLFTNLFSHSTDYSILGTHITLQNFLTRGDGDPAVGGIALGMSVAYTLEFFALFFIFHFTKHKINLGLLLRSMSKKVIAAAIMFTLMYTMYKTWNILTYSLPTSVAGKYTGSTTINLALLTLITVITSFLVYYLICLLLKVEELKILKKYLNPLFKLGGVRIK